MEPKVLPLIAPIGARYASLTVDSRLVNAIAELAEGEGIAHVYRRPAFKASSSVTAGTARGLFNWQGNIYAVVGTTLYKNGVNVGTVAGSGAYSFTATLGGTPRLFLQNGTNAYTITAADVFAAVADADYPSTTVGGAVYLDGTVYVMNSSSAIYGSAGALNDATSWDPLNLINAYIEPTAGIHLAKQLVYVLALKTGYSEAFYDAGNIVGSPLAPVQGAKMNYGCVDSRTVRDVGGDLMWVANTGEGGYCVVLVSALAVKVVSTPPVDRLLSSATGGTWYSWNAKIEGHRLYGVTNTTANFTLVYDLTTGLWYQWTDSAGNYLPYAFSCQGTASATNFLHATSGAIHTLDIATYVDAGDGTFSCDIYTPNFDGGTRREKTLSRMDFLGDQVASSTISVRYSDDDYATWSTALTANMAHDRPSVEGLGAFTKRAFRITHAANTAFRLKAAELYLGVGAA